ncbi:helix-turn-helix transcriptional regulator [Gorillibacterium timonense]|uniref:helix-turn-helix transcriptional regulator n=1 Tax=Gorillibacterium timonense TaxID=1689269 RepID=UPI00071E2358|nr:response regulator transcription factor [Gorillibacterium timonense]
MFRIHIVPFSMDAVDAFRETHSDIAIVDTSLFLPFEDILDQMYQYNWPFHVLLICHEADLDYPRKDNLFLLDKDTLSKELFHEIIDHIRQRHSSSLQNRNTKITVNWNGTHSVMIQPDSYHILVIRTFHETDMLDSTTCHTLIEKTAPFCNLHLLHTSGSIAIFYMNRSQIKKEFHYTQLSSLIFQILGQQTALFYKENISWKNLQATFEEMVDRIPLLYFIQGDSKSLQTLQHPVITPTRNDLKNQFILLLTNLLDLDIESAKHILQDIYIHTIKASYDRSVLEYIRMHLQIVYSLFFKERIDFRFPCIEQELAWLLESKLFIPIESPSSMQQDTVKQCILTLYNEYQTTISLDGIANKLGLNKIYVNRLFKSQFHRTIAECLHILRMQEAKYLLLFTNEKVYHIASSVGFSDTGYFIKTFRKTTGFSALEFRLLRENKEDFNQNYAGLMEI